MNNMQNILHKVAFNGIIFRDPSMLLDLKKACIAHDCFFLTLQESYDLSSQKGIFWKAKQIFDIADRFFDMLLNQKLHWEMNK